MDFLRSESIRLNRVHPQARDIIAFHKTFLGSVRSNGRLHEVGLVVGYKMKTGHLFQDATNAPKMFAKGLLNVLPHHVKGKEAIEKIFAKTQNDKEE
jgi:heterodisulfide reductase subunit C